MMRQAGVIHADETPWKQNGRLRWLWGVLSSNLIFLPIASRLTRLSGIEAEEMEDAMDHQVGQMVGDGKAELKEYGGMAPATVGVLLRKMVELEQRIEELEKIQYPQPMREQIYDVFDVWRVGNPWIGDRNIAPKGVVRDNGGHMVALKWTMKNHYGVEPGEVFWAASDVGWVVGHSYICYGPLLAGATTAAEVVLADRRVVPVERRRLLRVGVVVVGPCLIAFSKGVSYAAE